MILSKHRAKKRNHLLILAVVLLLVGAGLSRGRAEVLQLTLGIHMNCPYGLAG